MEDADADADGGSSGGLFGWVDKEVVVIGYYLLFCDRGKMKHAADARSLSL